VFYRVHPIKPTTGHDGDGRRLEKTASFLAGDGTANVEPPFVPHDSTFDR